MGIDGARDTHDVVLCSLISKTRLALISLSLRLQASNYGLKEANGVRTYDDKTQGANEVVSAIMQVDREITERVNERIDQTDSTGRAKTCSARPANQNTKSCHQWLRVLNECKGNRIGNSC